MDVRDIVRDWLQANGYDGLYEPGECACETDDLFPCGMPEIQVHCQPGVKYPCPGPGECHLDGDCGFHIGPKEQEKLMEALTIDNARTGLNVREKSTGLDYILGGGAARGRRSLVQPQTGKAVDFIGEDQFDKWEIIVDEPPLAEPTPQPIDLKVLDDAIDRLQAVEYISADMDMEHARGIIGDVLEILHNMQAIINPVPFKTACEPGLTGTNEPPEETI